MNDLYTRDSMTTAQVSDIQSRTFLKMMLALVISAVTAFAMLAAGLKMNIYVCLIGLLVVMAVNWWLGSKTATASPISCYAMLAFESIYMGALIGGTLQYYAPGTALVAFIVSAVYFGGLCIAGWVTKKDLTRIGNICMVALLCLIVCEVILMFIHAPVLWMVVSAVSLVIFAGLTAKDAQGLKNLIDDGSRAAENISTFMALQLYLDFINIFINILQLLGKADSR